MDTLRKPFFFAALTFIILAFSIEIGVSFLTTNIIGSKSGGSIDTIVDKMWEQTITQKKYDNKAALHKYISTLKNQNAMPPGRGISYLAILDGLLLFTLLIITSSIFFSPNTHAKIQGGASLTISLITLTLGGMLVAVTFSFLMSMIALFTAAPFGTFAYMATYGFFDTTSASVTLALIMSLKLAFVVCLVIAHVRFLQNKSLILIILSSFITTIIVNFLHNFVPSFLVSISDAISAIIVAAIGVIWAIFFLIGSLPAIFKVINKQP